MLCYGEWGALFWRIKKGHHKDALNITINKVLKFRNRGISKTNLLYR